MSVAVAIDPYTSAKDIPHAEVGDFLPADIFYTPTFQSIAPLHKEFCWRCHVAGPWRLMCNFPTANTTSLCMQRKLGLMSIKVCQFGQSVTNVTKLA